MQITTFFSNLFIEDVNTLTQRVLCSGEVVSTEKIQRIFFEEEYDDIN
jgi:hypothetical protein